MLEGHKSQKQSFVNRGLMLEDFTTMVRNEEYEKQGCVQIYKIAH